MKFYKLTFSVNGCDDTFYYKEKPSFDQIYSSLLRNGELADDYYEGFYIECMTGIDSALEDFNRLVGSCCSIGGPLRPGNKLIVTVSSYRFEEDKEDE